MADPVRAGPGDGDEIASLRRQLDIANQKLVESHKMAALGRLSAGVTHEIKTPIGSIFSNNDVILRSLDKLKEMLTSARAEGAPPTEKALGTLEVIAGLAAVDKIACERINSVIRSLKSFARVNEGELARADLNDLLNNTIKLTSTVFRRRIETVTDFGELPDIQCYPGLLNQVFLNLIVNAGQAIEDEGTITVRTRREGQCVHVSIQDTGRGIPEEVRPKIFTAGYTSKPIGEGVGLGLAITREIVEEAHHGSISFESEMGKGTVFHVILPIDQHASAENRSSDWQTTDNRM